MTRLFPFPTFRRFFKRLEPTLAAAFSDRGDGEAGGRKGSLQVIAAGIGLDIIRFPQGASPETVSADAVLSLAIMSGPVMFVLFAATVIVSRRYPLTAARHGEIMGAIEARTLADAGATNVRS